MLRVGSETGVVPNRRISQDSFPLLSLLAVLSRCGLFSHRPDTHPSQHPGNLPLCLCERKEKVSGTARPTVTLSKVQAFRKLAGHERRIFTLSRLQSSQPHLGQAPLMAGWWGPLDQEGLGRGSRR